VIELKRAPPAAPEERPSRRLPSGLEPLALVPDGEDQQVGADEEHDQALDDLRQVAREVGPENVSVQVPRRRAGEQRAEEQRGEQDSDRRVPAEERDGDPDEDDVRRRPDVVLRDPELPAEDVDGAGEPRERAEIAIASTKFRGTLMPP
jgi:hypothetical protein